MHENLTTKHRITTQRNAVERSCNIPLRTGQEVLNVELIR